METGPKLNGNGVDASAGKTQSGETFYVPSGRRQGGRAVRQQALVKVDVGCVRAVVVVVAV